VLTTGDTFAIDSSTKNSWFGTVRGRMGVAFDRSLLYLTGGLAVTQLKYSQAYSDTLFNAVGAVDASQTKTGWTVGAGWEYAFAYNWSVKAEYLYARFNGTDGAYTVVSTTGGTNAVAASVNYEQKQIARIGLNYLFNAAPAPVPVYGK
jgi:outer membrane immunogenic protein